MLNTPPRGGQQEILDAALRHPGFLLFPEQRVGKTWLALAIVDHWKPRKLLIACRKVGIREWQKQIPEHLDIDWPCDIRIITHESLNRYGAKEIRGWLKKDRDRDSTMVIVDESHKMKKRGTRFSRTIRQIGKFYAKYRLALSGTPLGQGLQDIWPQMDFVDPSVFGTFENFAGEYLKMGGFRGLKIVGYRNKKKFRRLLETRSQRKTLQEVRPVGKKYKVRIRKEWFDLSPRVRKIYDTLEDGLAVEVQRKKIKPKQMLHAAQKCHQLTGGFLIRREDDDGEKLPEPEVIPVHRQKLDLLSEVMKRHRSEKMVVVAKFKHELRAIRDLCRRMGIRCKTVKGGRPYDGRFNVDVIIIQIQSGISIDLSEAAIAIFYSADYSFILNAQMRSRILSYTQPLVTYYYLLGRDTIDEEIYEVWKANKKLSDVILDNHRRRAA